MSLAVIDGDIVAYRCSAANEKRSVEAMHNETAEVVTFDTATKFKEWAGETADQYTLTPVQQAGPVRNAFHSLKTMIERITEQAGCEDYHIVVSGDDNFRLQLPLPTQYKDSRKDTARPLQLKECKNYLIKHHNAEVSVGEEADDVLVAYAVDGYNTGNMVVQCSMDKDAKHGPGWLFDWSTMDAPVLIEGFGELQLVEKETARKTAKGLPVVEKSVKGYGRIWLYYQMVFGDPVDAYKPCELAKAKFGEIGAYELLKGCKTDQEALDAIVRQYKVWYPRTLIYKAWDGSMQKKNWLEIWQMYADCAFMRRWEGDRFDVESVLKKTGIDYA
jgi:hypothetical protein